MPQQIHTNTPLHKYYTKTLLQTIQNITGMHQREPVIGVIFLFFLKVELFCCPTYLHCCTNFNIGMVRNVQLYYVRKN